MIRTVTLQRRDWYPPADLAQPAPLSRLSGKCPSHHLHSSQRQVSSLHTDLHTCRSFKMTRCIVALRDEDVVVVAAFQRLIQRNRWP